MFSEVLNLWFTYFINVENSPPLIYLQIFLLSLFLIFSQLEIDFNYKMLFDIDPHSSCTFYSFFKFFFPLLYFNFYSPIFQALRCIPFLDLFNLMVSLSKEFFISVIVVFISSNSFYWMFFFPHGFYLYAESSLLSMHIVYLFY